MKCEFVNEGVGDGVIAWVGGQGGVCFNEWWELPAAGRPSSNQAATEVVALELHAVDAASSCNGPGSASAGWDARAWISLVWRTAGRPDMRPVFTRPPCRHAGAGAAPPSPGWARLLLSPAILCSTPPLRTSPCKQLTTL